MWGCHVPLWLVWITIVPVLMALRGRRTLPATSARPVSWCTVHTHKVLSSYSNRGNGNVRAGCRGAAYQSITATEQCADRIHLNNFQVMTIRRWSGTFSRCQGPLRTPSWHTLQQKERSIRYSGGQHNQTGLQFAITKHWKFCVCEQRVLWYWSCVSVCLLGARSLCFFFYLHQQDHCNYGNILYICQYIFLPSDIYCTVSYCSGRKQTYCVVCLVALCTNRLVKNNIVFVHCVDCGQILRILSMSVEYVQPPL